MKQWITLLTAAAMFASCSKQDLQQENVQQNEISSAAMNAAQPTNYVSGWEKYSNWERSEQGDVVVFTTLRKSAEVSPEVMNGGLVLTYAKVVTSDPLYSPFNNPKMLPFYFLPESERPLPKTFYFMNTVSNGNIAIAYRVPYTKQTMPLLGGGASLQNMQFQQVVITGEYLKSKGLDAEKVRNYYSYEQVMNLVNQ
jgi:hypothetical protein